MAARINKVYYKDRHEMVYLVYIIKILGIYCNIQIKYIMN